ncbi:MAG: peroxiredoxin Q/BCP [Patescibacteria group bacterium]|jgi:peroxiredoxin Q/BCP
MNLKFNEKAPTFSLTDKDGVTHSLSDLKYDFLVLYFYPKDNTGGCTLEAQEFTKLLSEFESLNTAVIGISGGTNKTKANFCDKAGLGVTLLSDSDFAVAKSYDSYGQKKFMGKEYMGIMRNTFVIGPNKRIVHIFENVTAGGHADEVLAFVRDMETR